MSTLATVLVVLGVAVCLLSCLAHLVLPGTYDALHAVTPVTSLGAPLVIAGLAVDDATLHGVAKLVLVAVVVMVSGPAVAAATARAAMARDGLLADEDRS